MNYRGKVAELQSGRVAVFVFTLPLCHSAAFLLLSHCHRDLAAVVEELPNPEDIVALLQNGQ